MKFKVVQYNENIFDVLVKGFTIITINLADEHNLALDLPSDGDGSASVRQIRRAVAPLIKTLNGEWFLGNLRVPDYRGNYTRTVEVTRLDLSDENFTATKKCPPIMGGLK